VLPGNFRMNALFKKHATLFRLYTGTKIKDFQRWHGRIGAEPVVEN
jgi:hypothetical protein